MTTHYVGSAIPVSPDCSMTIIADGEVTQEGLERLKSYIDLIKTWVLESDNAKACHAVDPIKYEQYHGIT